MPGQELYIGHHGIHSRGEKSNIVENDPESVCTVCSFIPCCLTSCDELIFHLDLDFGSRLSKGVSQPRVALEQLTTQPGGLVVVVFS